MTYGGGDVEDELQEGMPQLPDDVSLLGGDSESPREDGEQEDEDEQGPLLDLPGQQACMYALKLWRAQYKTMNPRGMRWRANHFRRMGVAGVRVFRTNYDHAPDYQMWVSPSSAASPPTSNMLSRICRRVADFIFSDPPVLEALPAEDTDKARTAAEFATRVLEHQGTNAGTRTPRTLRNSFDRMCTYGSGFRWHYIDPMGGGNRAKEVMASTKATHVGDGVNDPLIDPETGMKDPNAVRRYVAPDGTLVDKERLADREWVKALKVKILTGYNVRLLPETAEGIWDCYGVMIAQFMTLGEIKNAFGDAIDKLTPGQIRQMAGYRPERYRDLLPIWEPDAPVGTRPLGDKQTVGELEVPDDAYVFTLRIYNVQNRQYQHGCDFVMAGSKTLLGRGPWEAKDAEGSLTKLDLPVDQLKGFSDGEIDPYGISLAEKLGGMNEIRESQLAAQLDYLDQLVRRKRYFPIGGVVTPRAMQLPMGTGVAVNVGGVPTFEEIPQFPQTVTQTYQMMTAEMNDEAGFGPEGASMAGENVTSGAHAALIAEQMNKTLTELYENTREALERGGRIQLQLMSAFFTEPQKMMYLGPDNAWKAKEWDRTDLGTTRDVQLKQGTFTMLTPSVKASIAQQFAQTGALDPHELRKIIRSNMAPLLAIQDDPALSRIRRQIAVWKDGPSDAIKQQSQMFQQQQALTPPQPAPAPPPDQPAPMRYIVPSSTAAALQGGVVTVPPPPPEAPTPPPPPPPPVDPMLQACQKLFARQPTDIEPYSAGVRHDELYDVITASDFASYDPPWQSGLVTEYNDMRTRAGIFTLEEQRLMYQYQLDMQMQLREAPTTVLRGLPPDYDAPQPDQMGLIGGPTPGQPQPGAPPGSASPAQPGRGSVSLPTGHSGLPLLPPGAVPTAASARAAPPGGPAQGNPHGMPMPGGSADLHPGHVPNQGQR